MTSGVVKMHNRRWHSHQETYIEVPSVCGVLGWAVYPLYGDRLQPSRSDTGLSRAKLAQQQGG